MIKNNFYPIRTIVGTSIPISTINPIQNIDSPIILDRRLHPQIIDAVRNDVYINFLPDIIQNGITYHPLPGMDTMPVPNSDMLPIDAPTPTALINIFKNPADIPFPSSDPVSSIFLYQKDINSFVELQMNSQTLDGNERTNHLYSGRDRSYSFSILLSKEVLVGGMCFSGYPYILSRIENPVEGMTIGNFGLPREIRLTPLPSYEGESIEELIGYQRSQFIDSEFAYTRQEIISHSGLNYLTIDPVKTNAFILTVTDLPFIPKIIDLDTRVDDLNNPLFIKGYKGFAIPYLYFFEYKEQTKRYARLHAGLLGVKTETAFPLTEDGSQDILRRPFPEYEFYFLDEEVIGEETKVTEYATEDNSDDKEDTERDKLVIVKKKEKRLKNRKLILNELIAKESESNNVEIVNDKEINDRTVQIKVLKDEINSLSREVIEENLEIGREGKYILYSAHSALGQRREFQKSYAELNYSQNIRNLSIQRSGKLIPECFVSDFLEPGNKVTLYLQQGEELDRCVAGLKALFILIPNDSLTEMTLEVLANALGIGTIDNTLSDDERTFLEDLLAFFLGLPPEINFCEKIGLKIFEVDPAESVSPTSVKLDSKYATLLADTTIDDSLDILFSMFVKGIPFRRTSSSKFFAVELTNSGVKPGQVVINAMHLVRSAHVSVQPRPAKTQQIKALHYRIIGPELGDDFSRLGNEGFNFSIDRVVAGQTKNILYSAMSLLDLIHTGGARIQSNIRRRAVEFERAIQNNLVNQDFGDGTENIDIRRSEVSNLGWRRSETESNSLSQNPAVRGPLRWYSQLENWNGEQFPSQQSSRGDILSFSSFGNRETRIHTENLYPETYNNLGQETPFKEVKDFVDLYQMVTTFGLRNEFTPNLTTLGDNFNRAWTGSSVPRVKGTRSFSINPLSPILDISNLLRSIIGGSSPDPSSLIGLLPTNLLTPLIITGGGNTSVGVAPAGVGFNLGFNPFANCVYSAVYGSTGNISKTANEEIYSYSQFLNKSFDESRNVLYSDQSNQNRIIVRKEVEEFENKRVRGAEVMWQDKIQDIITGTIPLNFTLPATATKMNFRTADDTLRVRFNSGFSPSIEVDFWFELNEEYIRDDY